MNYPVLYMDARKIEQNTRHIAGALASQGMRLVAVAKGAMAHPAVVAAMVAGGAAAIGDSRIENLRRVREQGYSGETVLLRAPAPSRAVEAVEVADVSHNSDPATVRELGAAACRAAKRHKVILMVDLGDLREGVLAGDAPRTAMEMDKVDGVELAGIGVNWACYGGVIPTAEKMDALLKVKRSVDDALGRALPRVSGGNSANMRLVAGGQMPRGITELRMGESILLGVEPIARKPLAGCHPDAFTLAAEVIEVFTKPSKPWGETGQDAFGSSPEFVDRGFRRRAILAVGRQDVDPDTLWPRKPGVSVLGASSDHLMCDVEDADPGLTAGSVLTFTPGYGCLLRASTSPFVRKVVR